MRGRGWAPALFALACIGCGLFADDQARGGGLEGETLTLAGGIVYPDGSPAVGARVSLRTKDASDQEGSTGGVELSSGTTGPDGRYRITGIPPGEYFLHVEDSLSSASFQVVQVEAAKPDAGVVTLAQDTLKSKGSIRGRILLPAEPPRPLKGVVQVPGLGWPVFIDSTGAIVIDSVAPGNYSMRIVYTALNSIHRLDRVIVKAGETTDIGAFTLTEPAMENLADWPHILAVKVNATALGEPIRGTTYGFPLLIRLDSANFPFGQVGVPMDGADLRFTDGSGKRLEYEVESWDYTARKAGIWVKLDSLVGDRDDQVVRIHFGKPDVFSTSTSARVFDTANGHAVAYHFSNFNAGGGLSDATWNRSHLQSTGSGIAAGFIGLGYRCRSGVATQGIAALPQSASFTLAAWVRPIGAQGKNARLIWKAKAGANTAEYALSWLGKESALEFMVAGKTGQPASLAAKAPLPAGDAWIHIAATFDSQTGAGVLYLNGQAAADFSGGKALGYAPEGGITYFGVQAGGGNAFNGTLDEIRIYRGAHSPDRIAAEYGGQKPGSKLVGFP